MNSWIDKKYIQLISTKLEQFKKKSDDLWNCRCPICGDSKRNKFKARGYIFHKNGSYGYYCHNCGISITLGNLIKEIDPALYNQYKMEQYKEYEIIKEIHNVPVISHNIKSIDLETIENLPNGHWVKNYVIGRKIPQKFWNDLYYAPDFKKFVLNMVPNYDKELKEDDHRLVIPLREKNSRLFGFSGRALINDFVRYMHVKLEEHPIVFGLHSVDITKDIFVLEGQIDAFFLPNSIATCDSNLLESEKYVPKEKCILVFDREPRNKDILRTINKAIEQGFRVCLFPKTLPGKDVNDFIIHSFTSDEIKSIILENTFCGLKAKARFSLWKEI